MTNFTQYKMNGRGYSWPRYILNLNECLLESTEMYLCLRLRKQWGYYMLCSTTDTWLSWLLFSVGVLPGFQMLGRVVAVGKCCCSQLG